MVKILAYKWFYVHEILATENVLVEILPIEINIVEGEIIIVIVYTPPQTSARSREAYK